jgi:sec-independent protein translocase protein TatB
MFDVSFTELLTIGVVALIVIGPERLPKVARTVGHLLGRAQRYVNDVKSDIQREIELDELRSLRKEMEDAARNFETTVKSNVNELQQGLQDVHNTVEGAARDLSATVSGAAASVTAAASADSAASAETAIAAATPQEPTPQEPAPAPVVMQPAAEEPAAASQPELDLAQGDLFPELPRPVPVPVAHAAEQAVPHAAEKT